METKSFWDNKHKKYATEDWIDKPTIFAQWAIKYFPKNGKILDLGAGHGQDTRFFASKGYRVVSIDFSDAANKYSHKKLPGNLSSTVTIQAADISKHLSFSRGAFDVVYSHLSVHYFSDRKTRQVFSEIERVLKTGGIVAILVNSTDDPEYGQGQKLGKDFYELSPGDVKHFFSLDYMRSRTKAFKTIVLDNKGTTHKDNAKGVFNLIRFVGRKILL